MYRLITICSVIFLLLLGKAQSFAQNLASQQVEIKLKKSSISFDKYDAFPLNWQLNLKEEKFNEYYFVVIRFNSIPNIATQGLMMEKGIEIISYIPDNNYQVAIPKHINTQLLQDIGIKGIYALPSKSKIATSLDGTIKDVPVHARSNDNQFYISLNYPSFLKEDIILRDLEKDFCLHRSKAKTKRIELLVNQQQLKQLSSKPYVLNLSPIASPTQSLDYTTTVEYGSRYIHKIKGITGKGVTIGIGDNSKWSHPDGQNRVINLNVLENKHGNVVSGLVGGSGNISERYKAHAPESTIITHAQYDFIDNTDDLVSQYGMVLANHSYGNAPGSCESFGNYDQNSATVDQQLLDNPSLLHVLAAGNSGDDCLSTSPLGFRTVLQGMQSTKNGLVVGNLRTSTALATSSSRGPVKDGRIKPEICANGIAAVSTSTNNGYENIGGTSSAAPIITGVLGLMYEQYRKTQNVANPDGGLMKAIICNTATDLGNAGPDFLYGFGKVNAHRAVSAIEKKQYISGSITNGQINTHNLNIPIGTKKVKLLLYWHDKPSSLGIPSSGSLVNDLDLILQENNTNSLTFPWVLDTLEANLNNPATRGADHINNIEQITIDNPSSGDYTINVVGYKIPLGVQNYSISYDFIDNDIKLIHPNDGSAFIPTKNHYIHWESGNTNEDVDIFYSLNNGLSWNILAQNLSGTDRFYRWAVPNTTTSRALIRIVQGTSEATSALPFAILPTPEIELELNCDDQISISWHPIQGAAAYEIFRLSQTDTFMTSIGYSADTTFTYTESDANNEPWYAVAALTGQGTKSQRSWAKQVRANPQIEEVNFTYGIDMLGVDFFNLCPFPMVEWDFGDGFTSNENSPSHIFASEGNYNVCLTVYDLICNDSTLCKEVVISDSNCRVQDSLQLVAILNNLSPFSNLDLMWDDRPLEEWEGVTLTDDGCHVKRLSLPNGRIILATLPALNFPELVHLNLSGNFMNGEISSLYLPKVEEIHLYNNGLTGSLPDFSSSPFLKILNLYNNYLEGAIPEFIAPNLQYVYLNNNKLTGELPTFQNTFVKTLWVYDNNLSGKLPNLNNISINYLDIRNNAFTFDGMEENLPIPTFNRTPQNNVPVFEERETLFVEVGGTLSNNTYEWFNQMGQLMVSKVGDKTFTPMASGTYYCRITNSLVNMALTSELFDYSQKNLMELYLWLEGPFDLANQNMRTQLNTARLLPGQINPNSTNALPVTPAGHPYSSSQPNGDWFHEGNEGLLNLEYEPSVVDWILVSLYSDLTPTLVWQSAALLHSDGHVQFLKLPPRTLNDAYYILVEHRNHVAVLTPDPVPVVNFSINYDFRTANSYIQTNGFGFGQKQMPSGDWVMFAGEGQQDDPSSYDVNGFDKAFWIENNGLFNLYHNADFDLSGDVSGSDKNLWLSNNGVFSGAPKPQKGN